MSDELPPGTRLTKNSVLQDTASGRFLAGKGCTTAIRTSERGRELQDRRRELARKAAIRGIIEGASGELPAGVAPSLGRSVALVSQAWTQAALANAMDKPRESVTAGSAALKLAGLWPERGAAASGPTVAVQVNVSPELLRAWEKRIVDAEVRDIGASDISDEDAFDK
jgi:hypothetical protein